MASTSLKSMLAKAFLEAKLACTPVASTGLSDRQLSLKRWRKDFWIPSKQFWQQQRRLQQFSKTRFFRMTAATHAPMVLLVQGTSAALQARLAPLLIPLLINVATAMLWC